MRRNSAVSSRSKSSARGERRTAMYLRGGYDTRSLCSVRPAGRHGRKDNSRFSRVLKPCGRRLSLITLSCSKWDFTCSSTDRAAEGSQPSRSPATHATDGATNQSNDPSTIEMQRFVHFHHIHNFREKRKVYQSSTKKRVCALQSVLRRQIFSNLFKKVSEKKFSHLCSSKSKFRL